MGGYSPFHRFAVTQRGLFKLLQPIPGAPATLRRLSASGIRIRIITHRLFIKHFHKEAISQTIQWLDYYGIRYWDLCFMKEKAAVGANLYIDDSPENVQRLREQGNKTIVFSNSTNLSVPDPRAKNWNDVEELVHKEEAVWKMNNTI